MVVAHVNESERTIVNRPALASVVLLSAALVTAGCGGGSSSSAGSTASSSSAADGTQSYASMLDLAAAVNGGSTQCSGTAMVPTTVAKSQATCDVDGGKQLVLQLWRDAASRDAGVTALTASRAAQGYCVVSGKGDQGLWSVDASTDAAACSDIATRLGGQVKKAAPTTH